jgi:hypothetical protein
MPVAGHKPIMLRIPSCPNSFDSYHSMPVMRLGPSSLAWLLAAHSLDGDQAGQVDSGRDHFIGDDDLQAA